MRPASDPQARTAGGQDFLDPSELARMESLELIARRAVEGLFRGLHRSTFKGSSVEFAEHRPYVPGDTIGKIDWRTYARTDRFYLKEFEDETNLRATILLDASASMAYASNGLTKLHYAKGLAASLALLLIHQRDAVGLMAIDSGVREVLPPRASHSHFHSLIAVLRQVQAGGDTDLSRAINLAAERMKPRGLVIFISDLFDDAARVLHGLARFRHMQCEVAVFQVLDPAELEFPFQSWTLFRGLEGAGRRGRRRFHLDARQIRKIYLDNLERHLRTIQETCGLTNTGYLLTPTRRPLEAALLDFLAAREFHKR